MRILLIEDDPKITVYLKTGLEKYDFIVDHISDSVRGEILTQSDKYDLIILDTGTSVFELCKRIRTSLKITPVIILTSLDSVQAKVIGFDCGANDYLTKPFDFYELLARIKVLTRRKNHIDVNYIIKVLDLELNSVSKKVKRNNNEIFLTGIEFRILELLMRNKNTIFSKIHITEKIWGSSYNGTNNLDVHISSLRYKINKDCNNKFLHTKRGFGYVLSEDF